MSESSESVNLRWKAQQRAEAKEHANRPTRRSTPVAKVVGRISADGTDTTRQGAVIYHAKRRAALLEQYRSYGSNGVDDWGRVRQPVKRDVKLSELHLEPELFDHRWRHEGMAVREQTVEDLVEVLEREGAFEPLIDCMMFDGRLVVLDGHTRHQAYVRYFERENVVKTRGRKKERLTVLEHFGSVDDALTIARKDNSRKRQQHSERERKQIAWVKWLEDEHVSRPDQARAAGLGQTVIGKMRRIYNKVLEQWTREELSTKDWAGVVHLYQAGPRRALTPEEEKKRAEHEKIRAACREQADTEATEAIRQTFGKRPLKQPRRALVALVRNYGSAWLQELASDDRREHPELTDQDEPKTSDF